VTNPDELLAWLALALEPVTPPNGLRARLLATISGPSGPERLAPFVDRVAALFDITREQSRSVLALFDAEQGWTPMYPGAAFREVQGGAALGGATAGLVRVAAGLSFPRHAHIGEERVFVVQGAFVDDAGERVAAGQLANMADGSEHGFTVISEQELLYAVVVGEVEFEDGTRAP
jgi:putative transcriptional regulator